MSMEPRTTKAAFWQALGFAWQFGYTIAVPLVVFAVLGHFLDGKFGTAPWLFLGGILLAIASSSVLLVRKAFQITRSFERDRRDASQQPHQKDPTEPPSPEDPSL